MLKPLFDFSKDSVSLYKGIARVTRNDKKYGGIANIILKFSPKAHLLIKTEFFFSCKSPLKIAHASDKYRLEKL